MSTLTTTTTHTTSLHSTLPEYTIRATGMVRLILVINLGSFVQPADVDAFRHMRGSEAFAEAIRALRPHAPFRLDEAQAQIEQAAYGLRIFRSRLLHNHFFPTYCFGWDEGMRTRLEAIGCTDIPRWQRWAGRLRLTRNGLAVVTLEQPIDNQPLIACTEQLLELPSGNRGVAQDQWALGMTMLSALLDAIDGQITVQTGQQRRTVHFGSASAAHSLRLDRYVVYAFRKIERDGIVLSPVELKASAAPTLAAFMEGALVESDGERRYPRYAAEQARALVASDVSTWDEELCLFSGESALIYDPLADRGAVYVGGPHGLNAQAYTTYWAGIIRGVEHLVAFRSEAQQAERRTTDLLTHIPVLTRKVTDGHISIEDVAIIDHLAASVADIFDSLPELRSMAVSTSAFRADYVRQKFELLMHELAIQETLDLVNTNVEQLNFFLSYYNDMRLQWQGQRTNALGMTLGIILAFMAISSFLADTFSVVDAFDKHENVLGIIMIVVGGLSLLAGALYLARKRFKGKRGWWNTNGQGS